MKNQKRTTNRQILSLLLALLMLFFCFPVTALGTDELEEPVSEVPQNTQPESNIVEDEFFGEEEEFIPWELELEEGDLNLVELKTAELSPSETPEIISAALIEEKGHVNRLYEQEPDVFTIMFQNRDGGKTTYVFSHPVKTVSPSGSYTDMTASQIQAIVNSASASTNATAGMSGSLSLTASGNKMQINLGSDFIKSRLGNPDAEKPIMSYNIGEFVIFKAGASTLTSGIATATYDVTDEAREWATPGSQLPKFTFTPETDDTQIEADDNVSLGGSIGVITPIVEEEIVVMAVTVSDFAGEFSVKSTDTNNYLVCSVTGNLSTQSTAGSPYRKWYFQYFDDNMYQIIPMARQNTKLSYYDGVFSTAAQSETDSVVWEIEAVTTNTFTFGIGDYYYLSPDLDFVQGFDNPPPTWILGDGNDSGSFMNSVTIASDTAFVWKNSIIEIPPITPYPSSSYYAASGEYYDWICSTPSAMTFDGDYSLTFNSPGVYTVYLKYKFNPSITSNSFTVIVSDDYDITSGAVYLIRPYEANITANTKLLTMNVGTSSNTLSLSSWKSVYDEALGTSTSRWNDQTQAFTITNVGAETYKISAIMSTNQYNPPRNLSYSFSSYYLINKNTVKNTISMDNEYGISLIAAAASTAPNTLTITSNSKWYIYLDNSVYYFVNAAHLTRYLAYSSTDIQSSTDITSAKWSLTFCGVDAPCIKQNTDNFCGPASVLQSVYGYAGDPIIAEPTDLLSTQVSAVASAIGVPANGRGTYMNELYTVINGSQMLNSNVYKKAFKPSTVDEYKNIIKTSLENGCPIIVHVNISRLNYYPDSYTYGHYVCVIGYDSATGNVLISDCTYVTKYFGLYVVSIENLYNANSTSDDDANFLHG